MKLTKRIFAVIALIALSVACFAVSSSAEFTADNIEDVLEYYQYPDFVIDDFEDYAIGDSYQYNVVDDGVSAAFPRPVTDDSLNLLFDQSTGLVSMGSLDGITSEIVADPANAENGQVLKIQLAKSSKNRSPLQYVMEMNEATSDFIATMRVYVDTADARRASAFTISFMSDEISETFAALKLDFNAQTVTYQDNSGTHEVANFAVATNTWYEIKLVFNGATNSYTFEVAADGGQTLTSASINGGEAIATGALAHINGAIISFNATTTTQGCANYLDDVNVYSGTYFRNPSNKNEVTGEAMVNLAALRAGELDFDTEFRIAKVYDAIISGGYVPEVAVDGADIAALEALVADAESFMNKTYISAVCNAAAAINATQSYAKRMAQLATVEMYKTYLPESIDEIKELVGYEEGDDARLEAADALCEAERATLAAIKLDSDAFNALMASYDATSRDYYYICEIYDDASALTNRNTSYDGVFENEKIFSAIKEKRNSVVYNVETFLESVAKMQDVSNSFGVVYTSYVDATAVYNDGIIHVDIDLDNIVGMAEALEAYVAGEESIRNRIRESEEFISIVNRANSATYYSSIKEEIDNAAKYLDDDKADKNAEPEYAGMDAALASYEAKVQELKQMEKNADAYIAAVSELKALVAANGSYSAKKLAVASAKTLQESGNVLGYEGVKEANIDLAKVDSDIKALEGYSKTLIEIVNQLKEEKNLSVRRELILSAQACVEKAEKSYTGVSAAITALNECIAQYKADVQLVNSALANATKNAGALSSAAVNTSELY